MFEAEPLTAEAPSCSRSNSLIRIRTSSVGAAASAAARTSELMFE